MELFLDLGTKSILDAKDFNGRTPLHCAVLNTLKYSSHVYASTCENENESLQISLNDLTIRDKNDASFNDKNKSFEKGMCAIQFLTENGGIESIMSQDYNGVTSLHWASEYGCMKLMEILIEARGRDLIFVKDSFGKTAMDYATQGDNKEALDLLSGDAFK